MAECESSVHSHLSAVASPCAPAALCPIHQITQAILSFSNKPSHQPLFLLPHLLTFVHSSPFSLLHSLILFIPFLPCSRLALAFTLPSLPVDFSQWGLRLCYLSYHSIIQCDITCVIHVLTVLLSVHLGQIMLGSSRALC